MEVIIKAREKVEAALVENHTDKLLPLLTLLGVSSSHLMLKFLDLTATDVPFQGGQVRAAIGKKPRKPVVRSA